MTANDRKKKSSSSSQRKRHTTVLPAGPGLTYTELMKSRRRSLGLPPLKKPPTSPSTPEPESDTE